MKNTTIFAILRRTALAASALTMVMATAHANAQVPQAQTGSASPARVDEQLRARDLMPQGVPNVEVRQAPLLQAPAGAENMTFRLDRLTVSGVTVYSDAQLQAIYADKLGTTITLADLYMIASDLTRKYRNDGYILSQVVVPPQEIDGGSAQLRVVEGYIDQIAVEGAEDKDETMRLMRAYAAHIHTGEGQALNIRDLERALLLINDLPGVSARSVLSPSPEKVGAADLRVVVERDLFEGMVSFDNHGTRYLGPVQVMGGVAVNSLFNLNEQITAQLAVAPDDDFERELEYVAFGYKMPLGVHGTTLQLQNNYSFTDPGFDLRAFDVEGRSAYYAATISHPFLRTRNSNFTGRITYAVNNIRSSNNVEATRKDRIRSVRLGGRFEYLDNWFGAGFNVLDFELAQGLDVMGASDTNDFTSRPGADPRFTKLTGELQRLQRLFPGVNLLLAAKGQLSNDALYSAEEFGIGGMGYGRGFDPSEIIGDDGFAGKVELQWNDPIRMPVLDTYQLYGFWDAGRVFNTDPGANALRTDTVSSVGVGVRAHFTGATEAGLLVAVPLNRDVQTMRDDDPRVFFNVSHRF